VNNLCIFQPLGSRTLAVPENSINVLPVVDVRDVLRPAHELRRDQLQPDSHADYIFEQGHLPTIRSVASRWSMATIRRARPRARRHSRCIKPFIAAGEPYLAAVPLICFEWHQRPENVVAGHLTWGDYKRSDRPNWVRIEHHKTDEQVDMPLSDRHGPLFPELVAYLDCLERLGIPIVLMRPKRLRGGGKVAVPRPFLWRTRATAFARRCGRPSCRII